MIIVFEHSDLSGSDRLGRTLRDHGHKLDVRRLHRGDAVPADLDEVDAVVSCGGPYSANDDSAPWLADEIAYLRAAHESGRAVVGICLGSQLLARSLGGKVETMKGGIEAGWHSVRLTAVGCEDPLLAGIAWESVQPHWHREAVTELPLDARVLAGSDRCPHQAWAVGLRSYGFQYHPEIDAGRLAAWAEDEPGALADAGVTAETLAEQTAAHYPTCARLSDRLFEAAALLLMPVDRRYERKLRA